MRRHTRSRRWPNNLRVPPYRALHPADAEAWFMLGTLRGRSGDHAGAEAALRQALAVFPEFAQACLNLGHALEVHGNGAEAEACYLRAVALKPDLAAAHEALGRLCQQRGEWRAAEEHYQVALRLHPAATGAALALAALLTRRGRLSDALAALEQAWHHDRTHGDHACGAGARLEGVLAETALDDSQRRRAHFRLAALYDDLQDYDKAMAHFRAAHHVAAAGFDLAAFVRRIDG